MRFSERISSLFNRKSFAIQTANSWDLELQNIRRALGVVDLSVQQAFTQNDAVFAIVSRFVLAFQEPEIVVKINGETVPEHPVRLLLARPNPDTSESELYAQIATHWATGGAAYLHKLRNLQGQIVGLRAYSTAQITPQYTNTIVTSYIANVTGMPVQLPVQDVIFCPFPIRDDLGRGIPPFLPSMLQVMTDSEATRYLYSILKNDAIPRSVITQSGDMQLGNKDRERLRDEFVSMYGGVNRGKPVVLPTGANIERISLSLQELTLDALRKVPEARLCAALQVPPELVGLGVGLENSTYSNKAEARKSFVENTMSAYWVYCAESLERGLLPEFAEEFELEFDTSSVLALQENQDAKQARIITAWEKGVITRNEARMMLGLDALPEQDIFVQDLTQQSALPQPQAALQQASYQLLHSKAIEEKTYCGGEGCTGEGCANICPKNAEFYQKDVVMNWKNWDALAEDFSEKLAKSMQPVFNRLEKEIIGNINAQKALRKDLNANINLFDLEDFKEALQQATGSQLQEFLLLIARAAAAQVNTSWDDIQDDFARQLGELFGTTITKITDVADTLREELRVFLRGIADRPVPEIAEQLQEQFGSVLGSPARVRRIARTTATAATAGSQRITWETAGFKVVWLSQRDSKVRPAHRALDGKEVDADGLFRYTDENGRVVEGSYPANMSTAGGSVNCRCYLRPIRR